MRRDLLIVLVFVIAAAVVLAVGIYLLTSLPHSAPTPSTATAWTAPLLPGLAYLRPVLGPTTPLNDAVGGLWVINAARQGVIQMNLSKYALGYNENPFRAGNDSVWLDLSPDFGEAGSPLEAVYYIVPARDWAINGTTGPPTRTGAIAYFSGRDFVAADPFNRTVFFRSQVPFPPTWTGEDPASAGDMLVAPLQHVVGIGLAQFPVGPYEYFYASDGNHTMVFETDYVHAGYCPCAATSGRVAFALNATLSARPFVYYDSLAVTSGDAWRSGPGQALVFPLTNDTLEVVNVTGKIRGWVPLTLGGMRASVAGDIGFVQTPTPPRLFVPVRSSVSTGFVAIDLTNLSKVFEYTAGDASLRPVGAPLSRAGDSVYTAWYSPGDNRTRFATVNGTGVPVPQSLATVPGLVQSVFLVREASRIYAETQAGQVVTLSTSYTPSANVTPTAFPLALPSPHTVVYYAGSPGGTRYGTLLSMQELLGAWTDSARATTALFNLVPFVGTLVTRAGSPGAALPAGSVFAGALGLVPGALTGDRRTSCSATACDPRS